MTQSLTQSQGALLQGWGRSTGSRARVRGPLATQELSELLAGCPEGGVLARGAGCSYGDAAQNAGGLVLAPATRTSIELDVLGGTVRAAGSARFAEVLAKVVPEGLLLPVLPGTSRLTVGGAIAADVHGKNQRADGSLGDWLESIELLDGSGQVRLLTVDQDAEAFAATIGGMGLTGVILAATIRLIPISSTRLQVTSRRAADLDALLDELDAAARTSRYAVAWIDTTASGPRLGRGIVDRGDHLTSEQEPLCYAPARAPLAPRLPIGPFTPVTARAFNSLWYRKAPRERSGVQGLSEFFHRLDAVREWNRSLGPRGFLQYQFAVPDTAAGLLGEALTALRRAQAAPFLGTVKRFGCTGVGPLSFPLPGWSLAVDLPVASAAGRARLHAVLDQLDQRVAEAGGRIYLAKDARLGRAAFEAMYRPLDDWRAARARLDPADTMRSDLGRRLGLCP
ncbi:FAD-binding oxidoreductase [Kitasatospora kifunensis]|uniref:Decaprenylphospho-beta-D-ribofuranose 2-oxidase n=1 Tax=Kitasatospora kifunensis TaxID=58351 RepID=A0A7W7VUX8_KITKI|nr:FAD-binding oxidoreductase [Kitasatospora kifunensis]MBB4923802.1 decaprenylphospho-beta-D-ribofuranose 2-oxidase [Kitasatospora kifunensis]